MMQRTDWAEIYLEKFSSIPLTSENVFRSTEYLNKTKKEVVDLLLVLRGQGIFISMKCQQEPQKRKNEKLKRWTNKKTKEAFNELKGGIRTTEIKDYWCEHPRRGKVVFRPNEIKITHAVVLVETLEIIQLEDSLPLNIKDIPVSYFSVNDFLNILTELRTIKDLQRYLLERRVLSKEILTTLGIEKSIYEYYILSKGEIPEIKSISELFGIVQDSKNRITELTRKKFERDKSSHIIENVSDALSKRLENYKSGLDTRTISMYDTPANRKNYLLMQDELCDLVLDERRNLGDMFLYIMDKVKNDSNKISMAYQAVMLDSKTDFQYTLFAAKGIDRQELANRSQTLIRAALAEYKNKRGMAITYNYDIDNFDVVLVNKFEPTNFDYQRGIELFKNLKIKSVPLAKV